MLCFQCTIHKTEGQFSWLQGSYSGKNSFDKREESHVRSIQFVTQQLYGHFCLAVYFLRCSLAFLFCFLKLMHPYCFGLITVVGWCSRQIRTHTVPDIFLFLVLPNLKEVKCYWMAVVWIVSPVPAISFQGLILPHKIPMFVHRFPSPACFCGPISGASAVQVNC